jgi:hypothetical protein
MLIVCPIQPFLQSIKDYIVCSLSLPISPWVRHRNVLDYYASIIAKVLEIIVSERGPQVGNDAVREGKVVDNFVD